MLQYTLTHDSEQQITLESFLLQRMGGALLRSQVKRIIKNGQVTRVVKEEEEEEKEGVLDDAQTQLATVSRSNYKVKRGDTFRVVCARDEQHQQHHWLQQQQQENQYQEQQDQENHENQEDKQQQHQQQKKKKVETIAVSSVPQLLEGKFVALDIVFEDSHCAVINKPVGLIVHPAQHHNLQTVTTLAQGLVHHFGHEHLSHNGGNEDGSGDGDITGSSSSECKHEKVDNFDDQDDHAQIHLRPGIVHRIDADTSGLLVIAKNDHAHNMLKQQFLKHTITRKYRALIVGEMHHNEAMIESEISRHATIPSKRVSHALKHILPESEFNMKHKTRESATRKKHGKFARTQYTVLERFVVDSMDVLSTANNKKQHQNHQQNKWLSFALIECQLETGRTHQIRVHLSGIGRPLLGDRLYGSKPPKKPNTEFLVTDYILLGGANDKQQQALLNGGQLLHAAILGFSHPETGAYVEFSAKPPSYFEQALERLRRLNLMHLKRETEESDSMAF